MNTDTPLPDIHRDVSASRTIILDPHRGAPNTSVAKLRPDALSTHTTALGVYHNATNPYPTASIARDDLASSARNNTLENQQGQDSRNRAVSATRALPSPQQSLICSLLRLMPGERSHLRVNQIPKIPHPAHLDDHHPLHRRPLPEPSLISIATL